MMHVRHLAEAVLPLAGKVTITVGTDVPASAEFKTHVAPLLDRVTLDATQQLPPSSGSQWGRAWQAAVQLGVAIRRVKPDHVWVPTADHVTQGLGLTSYAGKRIFPAGVEAEGLMHRIAPAYPADSATRRLKLRFIASLLARAPWTRLHTVDHLAYEWMLARVGALARKARLLPDPIDRVPPMSKADGRRRLSIPQDGRYIGTCGALDAHKGVDKLVAAFAAAKLEPNDRLLLAGRMTPDLRQRIEAANGSILQSERVILMDRYLTDDELVAALAAMDVVATPSHGHIGISNIALRAQTAGRPVLGCDVGWQKLIVGGLRLGWIVNVADTAAFAVMIRRSLDESATFAPPPAAERLIAFHSQENYAAWITQRIRERMNLPPDPAQRDWQWVLDAT